LVFSPIFVTIFLERYFIMAKRKSSKRSRAAKKGWRKRRSKLTAWKGARKGRKARRGRKSRKARRGRK
jgi:hypothetical protein